MDTIALASIAWRIRQATGLRLGDARRAARESARDLGIERRYQADVDGWTVDRAEGLMLVDHVVEMASDEAVA